MEFISGYYIGKSNSSYADAERRTHFKFKKEKKIEMKKINKRESGKKAHAPAKARNEESPSHTISQTNISNVRRRVESIFEMKRLI